MKWLSFFFHIISFPFLTVAQDVNSMIKEGDRLELVPDEVAAFHKFREVLKFSRLICLCGLQ